MQRFLVTHVPSLVSGHNIACSVSKSSKLVKKECLVCDASRLGGLWRCAENQGRIKLARKKGQNGHKHTYATAEEMKALQERVRFRGSCSAVADLLGECPGTNLNVGPAGGSIACA
jgi:hypothetical protein